jgi:hypothetical protein
MKVKNPVLDSPKSRPRMSQIGLSNWFRLSQESLATVQLKLPIISFSMRTLSYVTYSAVVPLRHFLGTTTLLLLTISFFYGFKRKWQAVYPMCGPTYCRSLYCIHCIPIASNLGKSGPHNGPRLAHNRAHGKAVSERDATNAVFSTEKIVLKHDEH